MFDDQSQAPIMINLTLTQECVTSPHFCVVVANIHILLELWIPTS